MRLRRKASGITAHIKDYYTSNAIQLQQSKQLSNRISLLPLSKPTTCGERWLGKGDGCGRLFSIFGDYIRLDVILHTHMAKDVGDGILGSSNGQNECLNLLMQRNGIKETKTTGVHCEGMGTRKRFNSSFIIGAGWKFRIDIEPNFLQHQHCQHLLSDPTQA